MKINKTQVNKFCKELKIKYKSIIQTIKMEIIDDNEEKQLRLITILIKKSQRNKGYGSKIMSDITLFGDQLGIPIVLKATNIYGSDLNRLIDFYVKCGFFLIGEDYMKRLPN